MDSDKHQNPIDRRDFLALVSSTLIGSDIALRK